MNDRRTCSASCCKHGNLLQLASTFVISLAVLCAPALLQADGKEGPGLLKKVYMATVKRDCKIYCEPTTKGFSIRNALKDETILLIYSDMPGWYRTDEPKDRWNYIRAADVKIFGSVYVDTSKSKKKD